jgi:hypothetical protein
MNGASWIGTSTICIVWKSIVYTTELLVRRYAWRPSGATRISTTTASTSVSPRENSMVCSGEIRCGRAYFLTKNGGSFSSMKPPLVLILFRDVATRNSWFPGRTARPPNVATSVPRTMPYDQ